MSGRVDQFVAAMISGWLPNPELTKDTRLQEVVNVAIRLDQLIADHELKEISPAANVFRMCQACGASNTIGGTILHKAGCPDVVP